MNEKHKSKIHALVTVPFLLFLVFQCYYMLCNITYARIICIQGLFFSFLLFWGIYMFVFGCMNNVYRTTVLLSAALVLFGIVNQLKIAYSDTPVFLSDFFFLNSAGTFMDILKGTIMGIILKYLVIIVAFLTGIVYICKFAKNRNEFSIRKRFRAFYIILPILFMVIISVPNKNISHFMLKTFFSIDERQDNYATTNMGYYFKFGVFGGLYGQNLESRLEEPDGYDPSELEQLVEESCKKKRNSHKFGKPNIVMIFSESFWNIDDMKEVRFDQPVASNFEQLKQKGILVDMISPSYGGISSNVEYEMLTGSSIKFFSSGYIPYMQLYIDDKYIKAPSVIQELKRNGYKTHITSTWESSLFNCKSVYEYFGVDVTEYKEDLKDSYKKGGRISDAYVAERLIQELKEKPKDEKLFTMILTAQAHMPFNFDKYEDYDISIVDSKLDPEEEDTIRSYAQGVYDADKQLKEVYDFIQTYEEPTILIFYGDHLPYLKNEKGEDITKKLEYFNTGDSTEDLYRKYHTQCLILTNYDIGEDDIDYMGPDLVMDYLLNNMDLEVSPYYQWLYTTIDKLPASNLYVSVDKNGNKYKTSKLTGTMKDTFDLRRKMNWKYFVEVEVD